MRSAIASRLFVHCRDLTKPHASSLYNFCCLQLQAAASSTTSADYTLKGDGKCQDANGNNYTAVSSQNIKWIDSTTTDATILEFCASWCGQYTPSTFKGLETYTDPEYYYCDCLFDIQNDNDDDGPIPFRYTPPMIDGYPVYSDATGPIVGVEAEGFETTKCQ